MNAGELCIRRVVTADPDEPVAEIARRMRSEGVGDLIVVERIGDSVRPIGIVTDRDLVTGALVLGDHRAWTLTVRDLMREPVVTALEDEHIEDVLAKLSRHHVRRIPIVDDEGALQGILTLDDVVGWIREQMDVATGVIEPAHVASMP